VEIGGRMSRIEVAGEICLRRPRPTQGCRADDDDDDGCLFIITELNGQIMTPMYKDSLLNTASLIVEFFQLCFYDSYDKLESVQTGAHKYKVSSLKGK
jgi:hypothetical protein